MHVSRNLLGLLLLVSPTCVMAGDGRWTTNGPDGGWVRFVATDAVVPDHLVAATTGGLFRSADSGDTWKRAEHGMQYDYPYAMEASDTTRAVFLAPSETVLMRSLDGQGWEPTGLSTGVGGRIFDIALRRGGDVDVAVASASGLFVSGDRGQTFARMPGEGLPFPESIEKVDFATSTRLYAVARTSASGSNPPKMARSDDRGQTWTLVDLAQFAGYSFPDVGSLASAPSDPDTVYFAGYSDAHVSVDGGATWTRCGGTSDENQQLIVDPGNPGTVWLASLAAVFKSTDHCATWTRLTAGFSPDGTRPDTAAALALSPGYPADDRLWVGAFGGMYRSTDGAPFAKIDAGLTSSIIGAIAVHPVDASQILLGYGSVNIPSATMY